MLKRHHSITVAAFRRLAAIAVAILLVGCAGCGNPIACYSHPMMDVTVPIAALPEPTDAGLSDAGTQDLVDACQSRKGGCWTLCELAIGPENRMYIHTCELTTADGGVAVHVIASGYCAV